MSRARAVIGVDVSLRTTAVSTVVFRPENSKALLVFARTLRVPAKLKEFEAVERLRSELLIALDFATHSVDLPFRVVLELSVPGILE